MANMAQDKMDKMNRIHAMRQVTGRVSGTLIRTSLIRQARMPSVWPPWHQNHPKNRKQTEMRYASRKAWLILGLRISAKRGIGCQARNTMHESKIAS